MGHDTNQSHTTEIKSIISFKNSFWLAVILVGLFIAALSFVQVESAGEGEGGEEATHEMHHSDNHAKANSGEATHEEASKAKEEEHHSGH